MRVLVSGVNGFVGKHLVGELTSSGHSVVGVGAGEPDVQIVGSVDDYVHADLRRGWPDVPDVDCIVHLAAMSAVGPSFDEPQTYIESNSAMITHLGEYLLLRSAPPRVLLVSSGAVYDPHQALPIAEDGVLAFNSPYAVSKVLAENQSAYYSGRGLDWTVVRPFNHIGPGQGPGFLLPDLKLGIEQAISTSGVLPVGKLDTERDYTDVRDVVRAYRLLLEEPTLDVRVVNVCSGRSVSGQEILNMLMGAMGVDVETRVEQTRLRPGDPRRIVGNPGLLKRTTGWEPEYGLIQTVADFVGKSAPTSSRR